MQEGDLINANCSAESCTSLHVEMLLPSLLLPSLPLQPSLCCEPAERAFPPGNLSVPRAVSAGTGGSPCCPSLISGSLGAIPAHWTSSREMGEGHKSESCWGRLARCFRLGAGTWKVWSNFCLFQALGKLLNLSPPPHPPQSHLYGAGPVSPCASVAPITQESHCYKC